MRAGEKRVQTVTESRAKKVAARSQVDNAANRRKAVADTLKDIEVREKKEKVTLRLQLQRAGLDVTPKSYWIASAGLGIVVAISIYFSFQPGVLTQLGALVGGFVGMFGLPRWVLYKMIQASPGEVPARARQCASTSSCAASRRACRSTSACKSSRARAPSRIASEFREVVEQQRVGVSLGEALERLAQRVPLAEVRFLRS